MGTSNDTMPAPSAPLRRALTWSQWWPSVRAGLWVLALFACGVAIARWYATPIEAALAAHGDAGVAIFVITSALAVLMPAMTNLPLVPLAVLAWGPWWTAALLLLGWTVGSALSFVLGRHARDLILRRFPSVQRHADIERLIHPRQRMASLVLLRMTFPVDVLSYALGLFSPRTTLAESTLATVIGAAPFALLFGLAPVLPPLAQLALFVGSALVFVAYLLWVLQHPFGPAPER
jgi:uncharacterized membrane protein YdjX (TVP38/TMEM64 family)